MTSSPPDRTLPPPSPCRKICEVDPGNRICTGCGRTLSEIARWSTATPEEQWTILDRLPDRLAALAAKPS